MPKRKAYYDRDILRHLIDDEARGDDLFESTDDEEDVVSVIDDDLVDSDDDTAGSFSPNCCDEAIVDVFSQVTFQHTWLCSVSWFVVVTYCLQNRC